MPTIQDYMRQFDAQLATEKPKSAVDLTQMPLMTAPKPAATSGKMTDLLVTGAKGVIGAGEAAVGLANLPTFGYAGKALESIGYRPEEAHAALEAQYSPYRQELNKGLADTKGFMPTVGYMMKNPSTIGHAIVESIPSTLGGGAIAQGLKKVAPAMGIAARAGIGEGAVIAGGTAEGVRQQTESGTLSAGQVGASLASGAIGGLIGAKSAGLATRLGLPDIDVSLAGGSAREALKPGYLKRVGTAALIEGVFEELPQSAQEQVWRNVALGKPFGEGVAEAAAQGMLAGMGMGAGFAATQIRKSPPNQVTDDTLKGAIDEHLAPPAPPMQAEWDAMQQAPLEQNPDVAAQRQAEREAFLLGFPEENLYRLSPAMLREREVLLAQRQRAASVPAPNTALAAQMDRQMAEAGYTVDDLGGAPTPAKPNIDREAAAAYQAERESLLLSFTEKQAKKLLSPADQAERRALLARRPVATATPDVAGAQARDRQIAVDMGLDLFGREGTPIATALPQTAATEPEGLAPATDLSATPQMFDEQGRVNPEVLMADRQARARPRTDVEEVAARLQAAREVGPQGQAALMAGQLPTPSPIVVARGSQRVGGVESTLNVLPRAAKVELGKSASNPEMLAAAVADMYYTKMSQDAKGKWIDKLPALYQQLTGQALPESPAQVPVIAPSAIGAQGAEFLQGETPEQAAANYARQQELAALETPLPDVTVPRKQTGFLTPSGEVDTLLPGLNRRESARQTAARKFAAKRKAERQKLVAEKLGTNIPEVTNAVQKPVAAAVDVRQPAKNGEKVAEGNAQGPAAAEKGPAKVKVKASVTPIRRESLVAQGEQDDGMIAAMVQATQEDEAALTPEQKILDAMEYSFDMELSDDDRTMLTARLKRAKTVTEKEALATKFMEQAVKNKQELEKAGGKSTSVVKQRGARGGDNAAASTGTGRAQPVSAKGDAGGRAAAPAASVNAPVAVEGGTAERPADLAEEAPRKESAYAKSKERSSELREYIQLYEDLVKPADMPLSKFKKRRVAYLASIAEVEANADTATTRRSATKYLEAVPDKDEVAQARREVAVRVRQVGDLEAMFKAQNEAVAKLVAAQEAQLAEYEQAEAGQKSKRKSRTDRTLEKDFLQMDESGAAQGVTAPGFHTQTSLAVELAKVFGQKFMDAVKSGRVVILPNQLHLAAVTGRLEHRLASNQGLYVYDTRNQPDGVTYFVAGNISQTVQGFRAVDIALHEIGEHAGMQHMLGKQNYMRLLTHVREAMAKNDSGTSSGTVFDKDVAAAQKRLLKSQKGQAREVLAYMIQHTPDANILKKMWSQIKAWLVRRGWMDVTKADAQTLRALAEGATSKWLTEVGATSPRNSLRPGVSMVDFSGAKRAGMTPGRLQSVLDKYGYADGRAKAGVTWLSPQEFLDATTSMAEQARLKAEIGKYGPANLAQSVPISLTVDPGTGRIVGHEGRHRMTQLAQAGVARVAVVIDRGTANNDPFPTIFLPQQNAGNKGFAAASGVVTPITYDNVDGLQQKFVENVDMAFSGVSSPTTLGTLTDFKAATDAAKQLLERAVKSDPADMQPSVFKGAIAWMTKHHLMTQFDKMLNGGLSMNVKADTAQETTSARFSQMFNEPYHKFEALMRSAPERAKKIGEIMMATRFKLDPRKTWEQHTHLQSLAGDQLTLTRKYHNEYVQIWGQLKPEEKELYNDLAKMNEALYTAELAVTTYNMVRANPSAQNLAEFQADPTEEFRQSTAVHGSIDAALEYWRGVLDSYTDALDKHVAEQRGTLPERAAPTAEQLSAEKQALKNVKDVRQRERIRRVLRTAEHQNLNDAQKKVVRHLSSLEAQLRTVTETTETFEHAPYFHLGRFGDNFVSFRVRTAPESEYADPEAMEYVQGVLADEFPDVTIQSDSIDPHVFARFETVAEAQAFTDRLRQLQKQGWLMQPGVKDKNNEDLGQIKAGVKNDIIKGYHTAGPNWLSRVVESIKGEGFEHDVEQQMIAHVRALYLDSLPDTAALKVKQKREGRPGWSSDMIRSYSHRMRVGTNRVASLAAEPTRTQSFAVMKDAILQSQTDEKLTQAQRAKMAAVVSEFERRNSESMSVPETPGIDTLRAVNHAYFLGMSPSYVLIQMTQLGVLTWPELAKKHGYVKAARAIASVTNTAFQILKTVIAEGYKTRGVKGAADMVVTGEMLERAGVSKDDAEFLVKVMASGKLDIGNASRELGRVAEGVAEGKWGTRTSEALRVASAFGYASETLTRTITALAAKRLHNGKDGDVVKYAIETIDESMLNYTTNNIGRMTGKQGLVGRWTPVMFSFMQYQFQLLEKLYREFYTAFAAGATDEQKAEARRFLGGHLASMMVLAGSLGLPFATAVAAAADKLCDMFGDGHCDSKTALRNMTSDVFGSDIEPLISRGLVRAAGFDVSDRAGEANILPFSKFLADKRKMDERLKDLAWSSWGAPSSMIANVLKGYEKVAQGDLLGGMQEAVPLALKGPLKAFQMSEKGYTDASGNQLPMTAGAWDMMLQTVGLNPGEKADYQQAKFAQAQRRGVMKREGTQIRQKLASAIERGDQDDMKKWMSKAREFDAENPGRGILPQMGAVLQQRAKARATSAVTGAPLGVSPKDVEAMQFTRFMQPQ